MTSPGAVAFAGVILSGALLAIAQPAQAAATVTLPGLSYEVLTSGPAVGGHPTRADVVTLRYIGRLANGLSVHAS